MELLYNFVFPSGFFIFLLTALLFWRRFRRAKYQLRKKEEMVFKALVLVLRKSFRHTGPPVNFDDFYRDPVDGATVIQIKVAQKNLPQAEKFLTEYNKVLRDEVKSFLELARPVRAELVVSEDLGGLEKNGSKI